MQYLPRVKGTLWQDLVSIFSHVEESREPKPKNYQGVRNKGGKTMSSEENRITAGSPSTAQGQLEGLPGGANPGHVAPACQRPEKDITNSFSFFPLGCWFISGRDFMYLLAWLMLWPKKRVSAYSLHTLGASPFPPKTRQKLWDRRGFMISFLFTSFPFSSGFHSSFCSAILPQPYYSLCVNVLKKNLVNHKETLFVSFDNWDCCGEGQVLSPTVWLILNVCEAPFCHWLLAYLIALWKIWPTYLPETIEIMLT